MPRTEGALAGWREGPAKRSIIELVARATGEDGSDPVPVEERLAVFDKRRHALVRAADAVPARLHPASAGPAGDDWTVVSVKNDWATVFDQP